jgi:hypothetical protein
VHHLNVLEAPQGAQQVAQAQPRDLAVRYRKLQNRYMFIWFQQLMNLQG